MTERENILRIFRGEDPAWLPRFTMMPATDGSAPPIAYTCPDFMTGFTRDGDHDVWGVEYVGEDSVGGATIPVPGKYLLDDITKWRDVIKAPDISGFDWEMMAKHDTAFIDREKSAVCLSLHTTYFQGLISFMGFENAFVAMMTEPEEVHALFDYMGKFYEEILRKAIPTYKPDYCCLTEDSATAKNPFISTEMYREMLKPYYKRFCDIVRENDMFMAHHNCGRCEDFIPDWIDMGISIWDPAQIMNDLDGIKAKYGRKLVMCGCWDSSGPSSWDGATEEQVRQEVRDCIDHFAPGGGFLFGGGSVGRKGDEGAMLRNKWITEEYESYGRHWYDHH